MIEKIKKEFSARFGKEPEHIFFSPGRINLIGEHIDYNGGKVMPCAISLGTYLAVKKNVDKRFKFFSLNFPEKAELKLQSSYSKAGQQWFNFPLGVINYLLKEGHSFSGLDMLFYGNLPVGAGLSSSASIEVVTAYAFNEIFLLEVPKKEMAVFCKKVENEFIGVNCGIMDQFAVAMGKIDNAILLNCDSLEHEYIPFEMNEYSLVVINTKKERTLVGSKYNERFAECGEALKALKTKLKIQNLCDLDVKEFNSNLELIKDRVIRKRALHVISENDRVKLAAIALKKNDLPEFGKLMYASHQSLQELYEVSGKELDTIVEFCKTYAGCIGARMTGAGFGGCAIALIKKENLDDFANKLTFFYKEKIGYEPEIFASKAEDGVREVKL